MDGKDVPASVRIDGVDYTTHWNGTVFISQLPAKEKEKAIEKERELAAHNLIVAGERCERSLMAVAGKHNLFKLKREK